jgi:hypothetical protein
MGEIWSQYGSLLGYFEYNGTCDVVCTRVHLKAEDVRANWRMDNDRKCVCAGSGQDVLLYTTYGGGFYWDGRVCWNCMAITDGIYDFELNDGRPFKIADVSAVKNISPGVPVGLIGEKSVTQILDEAESHDNIVATSRCGVCLACRIADVLRARTAYQVEKTIKVEHPCST